MILIKTKKKIIIASIFAFSLFALYYFLVVNILQNGREISSMSQKIKDNETKKNNLFSMQENLALSKDKAIRLQDFILKAESEVEFIKKIEDLAISSNVKSEIKTAKVEEISKINSTVANSFRVGLNAVGSWGNVVYFLTLIENLPLKITINNVSFDKFTDYKIDGREVPQWLLSIDFSVIKQK